MVEKDLKKNRYGSKNRIRLYMGLRCRQPCGFIEQVFDGSWKGLIWRCKGWSHGQQVEFNGWTVMFHQEDEDETMADLT